MFRFRSVSSVSAAPAFYNTNIVSDGSGVKFVMKRGFLFEEITVPSVISVTLLKEMANSIWMQGMFDDALEFLRVAGVPFGGFSFAQRLERLETSLSPSESIAAGELIVQNLDDWISAGSIVARGGAETFFDAVVNAEKRLGIESMVPASRVVPGTSIASEAVKPVTTNVAASVVVESIAAQAAADHCAAYRLPVSLFPVLSPGVLASADALFKELVGAVDRTKYIEIFSSVLGAVGLEPKEEIVTFVMDLDYDKLFSTAMAYCGINGLPITDNVIALAIARFANSDLFAKLTLEPRNAEAAAEVIDLVTNFEPGRISFTEASAEEKPAVPVAEAVTTPTNHNEAVNNLGRGKKGRNL